jgi:hypothetical protein
MEFKDIRISFRRDSNVGTLLAWHSFDGARFHFALSRMALRFKRCLGLDR